MKYPRVDLLNKKQKIRKSIEITGLLEQDHKGIKPAIIDIFVTCDDRGKTISFYNMVEGVMITVPFEGISDLLKEVMDW